MTNTKFTTKATRWKDGGYACCVFFNGEPIVQAHAKDRLEIGAIFRDLLRTLDKCGGDKFTAAARRRKFKDGNLGAQAKHKWSFSK